MMLPRISLKRLTEKQRQVWLMRYRKRWRMTRIALELGMSPSNVRRASFLFQNWCVLGRETVAD
jgi:DNA-directed RNA polymerase specialized sigma24 family protein